MWLQERACKRNEAVIAAGRSTRVLQEAVRQWTSESTRLRKLRQGLSLLVAKHDFRESQVSLPNPSDIDFFVRFLGLIDLTP